METHHETPVNAPPPAEPDAVDQERSREERMADETRRLREREWLRAQTSVPPPGR